MKNSPPLKAVLNFHPLIAYTRNQALEQNLAGSCMVSELEKVVETAPELNAPMPDPEVLKNYTDQLNTLMHLIFPPVFSAREAVCAIMPFSDKPFFSSPVFADYFLDTTGCLKGELNVEQDRMYRARMIKCYLFILEKFYGIKQHLEALLVRKVKDPETGLDRFFNMQLDFRFVEVKAINEIKPLSREKKLEVLESLNEPDRLMALIPPENFELHGFIVQRAVDVTVPEIMSALERELIDQETIISKSGFSRVQDHLRSLFGCDGLVAGISALTDDQVLLVNSGSEMDTHCIFASSWHVPVSSFADTPWAQAVNEKRVVYVPDIQRLWQDDTKRKRMFSKKIKPFIIAPLIFEGNPIGTLSIGAPETWDLSPIDAFRMEQLQPIFTIAVKRALSNLDLQIEKIIKEKCTAIHPSVEWRFKKAAFHHLDNLNRGHHSDIEPIVFPGVYSLFGQSDIRGSTDERNQATLKDLMDHLDLATAVVSAAGSNGHLMILKELEGRIEREKARISKGIGTGDEQIIVDFLKHEVEGLFDHLTAMGPDVAHAVDIYKDAVDPESGTVYRQRGHFEESVAMLNDRLGAYLESEASIMQKTLPHYFEMHRTDGVDYLIYAGQSILEKEKFSSLYLKDLRLWQIRLAAGMAWHTHQLKPTLKVPLDTAHLILIQNSPISIRFRYDERRFDVDGAYDTRQEIIKSRIDKARLKGSQERLTQPGKIAIVYSLPEEETEILRHLEFFHAQQVLTGETETIVIDDLPGVQGLKAIRAAVDLNNDAFEGY